MNRTRKYLILILIFLTALLCAVGVSTWIITTPISLKATWDKGKDPVWVNRYAEFDYKSGGVALSSPELENEVTFCDESGNLLTTADIVEEVNGVTLINATATNGGGVDVSEKGTITVGSTYEVSKINLKLKENYILVGTFKKSPENTVTDQVTSNDFYHSTGGVNYTLDSFLVKYKTVYQGTPSGKENPTYYTIEDALSTLNGTISIEAGKTSFTALSDNVTGYTSAGRTLSSGKTLLIPYSAADSGSTLEAAIGTGNPKSPYATLIVPDNKDYPNDLTINGGTLNVNALRSANSGAGITAVATDNGCLEMKQNAHLEMSGGVWECIGFAYGAGTITVTGGNVYENFTMFGWKGGSIMLGISGDVFPLNQYSLNSIICKTTFTQQANLQVKTCVTVNSTNIVRKDIKFLSTGSDSFLHINAATKVTKWVDEETNDAEGKKAGRVHFEVDGDLNFSNLSFTMSASDMGLSLPGSVTMTTANKQVPLPGNFAISLASGTATIPQGVSLKLLPGATLNVAKNAKIMVQGSAFAYGQGNAQFEVVSKWQDGNSIKAYPYGGAEKTYREAIPTMGYNNETPAEVIVDGVIEVAGSATIGATFSGNQEGGQIVFTSGSNVSGRIEEDYTASSDLSGGLLGSTAAHALTDQNQNNPFYATLSAKGELSNGFGNFEAGKTYTYSQGAWRTPASYTVNYHANGENVVGINEANGIHSVTKTAADGILEGAEYQWSSSAPEVSRAHYIFGGWYTNEACTDGSEALDSILGGGTLNLYAKWTPIEYAVQYVIEGYNDYTLNTENFGKWTIEKSFDLSALTPTGLPGNTVFVGWYNDSVFTTQITILDKDQINNITPSEDHIITLYGQVNELVQYTVHYDYTNKPTDDGENYAKGKTGRIDDLNKYNTGSNVSADYIDALYTEEESNRNSHERKYYFLGWFDEANNPVPSGATIQATMDVNSDGEIAFTAKWAMKARVTITGPYTNSDLDGFYKPGDLIDLGEMYTNVTVDDCDASKQKYFNDWEVTDGAGDVVANAYTVPADYSATPEITIEAKQAEKVTITVNVTGKSTITLTVIAENVINLPNAQSGSHTYYLKPGTVVHYSIRSTAKDGQNLNKDGWSAASGNWSINGAKMGDKSGSSISGDGEFTMPESGSGVTIIATSADGKDGSCIVEGTLIMMADGTQKPVEEVKAGDEILVFNHETGKYETGKVWFNDHENQPREWHTVVRLKFSDGSEIGISYRHGFFDLDLNKYVYIDELNYEEFVGHRFTSVKQVNGEFVSGEIKLVSGSVAEEYIRVFSPLSEYHFNMVTDGLLSVANFRYGETGFFNFFEFGEGMKYDEEKMQADIEKYGLFTYEEFADLITYDIWCKAPVQYLKISIAKGLMTFEDIELTVQWMIDQGYFG